VARRSAPSAACAERPAEPDERVEVDRVGVGVGHRQPQLEAVERRDALLAEEAYDARFARQRGAFEREHGRHAFTFFAPLNANRARGSTAAIRHGRRCDRSPL